MARMFTSRAKSQINYCTFGVHGYITSRSPTGLSNFLTIEAFHFDIEIMNIFDSLIGTLA